MRPHLDSPLKLSVGMERAQVLELKHAWWDRRLDDLLAKADKNRTELKTRPRMITWKLRLAQESRDAEPRLVD